MITRRALLLSGTALATMAKPTLAQFLVGGGWGAAIAAVSAFIATNDAADTILVSDDGKIIVMGA